MRTGPTAVGGTGSKGVLQRSPSWPSEHHPNVGVYELHSWEGDTIINHPFIPSLERRGLFTSSEMRYVGTTQELSPGYSPFFGQFPAFFGVNVNCPCTPYNTPSRKKIGINFLRRSSFGTPLLLEGNFCSPFEGGVRPEGSGRLVNLCLLGNTYALRSTPYSALG